MRDFLKKNCQYVRNNQELGSRANLIPTDSRAAAKFLRKEVQKYSQVSCDWWRAEIHSLY